MLAANSPKKIRVICVDDSALIRGLMAQIINQQPDMHVVALATDPLQARELIKQHNPDVLTLDVEMPHMDGLDFLERLMRLRPMPVIMVSSLTARHSDITLRALELGAVDFVTKPRTDAQHSLLDYSQLIAAKIRVAAQVPAARLRQTPNPVRLPRPVAPPAALARPAFHPHALIAIGASTGGPEALRHVLQSLPADLPPILITQHMPAGFTRSFVQRLDRLCALHMHEAEDAQPVQPGHVYLAPGSIAHMRLERNVGNHSQPYLIKLDESEAVNRHRPSVDVLFQSVAQTAGRHAIGLILTGMGKDGAQGLLAMKQAGSPTCAQDEASSVVYGMPAAAAHIGAADTILPLEEIGDWLVKQASNRRQPGQTSLSTSILK